MKYAIIAAGEGSRLAQEGIKEPKPLVRLKGEALIDRLVRVFNSNGATEIDVIINNLHTATERHLEALSQADPKVRYIVQTTPSSMHSLHALAPLIRQERFCLTTVDTVFSESEFAGLIARFNVTKADALMAVTAFIDDEKPLYVATDPGLHITGFHDSPCGSAYVSAGIYCLRPNALPVLARCIESGQSRMRNFQRALVASGLSLEAYPMSKVMDVDHAEDISKAEQFLATL